jgi:AcrR family transcriptional regulator
MAHELPEPARRFSLPVKQSRSQKTRDRLLAAGFKLLRRRDFDQLSVADIARAANCAVGSFYQRFFDKDQYFFALAEMRRAQSRGQLETWYDGAKLGSLVERAIERELGFVLDHPDFWRAALRRGTTDSTFWEEFRALGRASVERFVEVYSRLLGRTPGDDEVERIRFAFQMVRGTLNNTLINQPGPLSLEDAGFRRQMERAFRLVAGIEAPNGAQTRGRKGARS